MVGDGGAGCNRPVHRLRHRTDYRYNADTHDDTPNLDAEGCLNADSRSNASADCYATRLYFNADSYTDANGYARPYPNPDTDAYAHSIPDTNGHAIPISDARSYPCAHGYALPYINTGTDSHASATPDTHSHPCADSYPDPIPNADIHAYANSHSYSRQG